MKFKLKGNYINIFSIVLGIIGVVIGVIPLLDSQNNCEISYFSEPAYKIYDSNLYYEESPIIVLDNDSVRIKEDVFLKVVYIWNSGDLPIDTKYIKDSLNLRFSNISSKLDLKIIGEDTKSAFKLREINDSLVVIGWKNFFPDDTIRLQLMYVGKSNCKQDLSGDIFGVSIEKIQNETVINNKAISIYLLVFSIIIIGFAFIMEYRKNKILRKELICVNIRLIRDLLRPFFPKRK
jgi:hypothetical protein